jgi:hypothetical protein
MKQKTFKITPNEEYKDIIVKELDFVLSKMNQANDIDEKLYFFSAVQGVFNRVLNLDFREELLYAFFVTNDVYRAFQQKLISLRQGDMAAKLNEYQISKLMETTKEFLQAIVNDNDIDPILKKYIRLSYSTTGNGYYLAERGKLKI